MSDIKISALAQEFLGLRADASDPASLLALPPDPLPPEQVFDALRKQVQRVAGHPSGNTLDADELRLALHAAAARLIDPAWQPTPATPARDEVLRALGPAGWNRDSSRRLAALAAEKGVTVQTLLDALQAPSASVPTHVAPPPPHALPSYHESPLPEQLDPAAGAVKRLLLIGALATVGVATVIAAGIFFLSRLPNPVRPSPLPATGAQPPAPVASSPSATVAERPNELFPAPPSAPPSDPTPKPRVVDPSSSARIGDFTDLLRELSTATGGLEIDPSAALDRFDTIYSAMAVGWVDAGPDALVAGVNGLVEFVYRASANPALGQKVVERIARQAATLATNASPAPQDISRSVWSAGILTRLLRERDLPSNVRDSVRESVAHIFGDAAGPAEPTFRAGAMVTLISFPGRITLTSTPYDDAAAKRLASTWDAWVNAVTTVANAGAREGEGEELREFLLLEALERLIIDAQEPTVSRLVHDSITLLASQLHWRENDESRRALLRWFSSPAVSLADLQVVTTALATRSSAEGVDYSMVLSMAGGDAHRAELRDRYAVIWKLAQPATQSELLQRWVLKADEALGYPSDNQSPTDALARAVNLARLNEAAWMLWAGATPGVPDILDLPPFTAPPPAAAIDQPVLGVADATGPAASWAIRYLSAGQAIPPRRELLTQLSNQPTPLEADIIVEEAVRGSPVQVRQDAQSLVRRHASEPTIINAFLEMVPMIPQTRDNTELARLVASGPIPTHRDPAWRVGLRRALVERLVQAVADKGEWGFADRAADELAESYRGRVLRPGDARIRGDGSSPPLESSAAALRLRLRKEAQNPLRATGAGGTQPPVRLATLDARHAARADVAAGRIQSFAAEQVSVFDLLTFLVNAEQPRLAHEIAAISDLLARQRRTSRHINNQIFAVEEAMLRLWKLRLSERMP